MPSNELTKKNPLLKKNVNFLSTIPKLNSFLLKQKDSQKIKK